MPSLCHILVYESDNSDLAVHEFQYIYHSAGTQTEN